MLDLITMIDYKYHFVTFLFMCLRGTITYFFGLLIVRLNRKLIGTRTPFNFFLYVMLGSIGAATIIAESPFFIAILGVILFLSLLNHVIVTLAYYFPRFEKIIKGNAILLIKDGQIQWKNMKKMLITKTELQNALQEQLHTKDFSKITFAFLATDGTINFLIKEQG